MSSKILGIDLGISSLSAVVVERSIKGCSLIASCTLLKDDLKAEEAQDSNNSTESALFLNHTVLNALGLKMDISQCSIAAVAVPALDVSFRTIDLPFTSAGKIRQVLPFELGACLPLTSDPYLSDFILINATDDPRKSIVFTASIPEPAVKDCYSSFEAIKIKPQLITPQGYCAAQWFLSVLDPSGDFLIICLLSRNVSVSLAKEGTIVHVRSLGLKTTPESLSMAAKHTVAAFGIKSGFDFSPGKCVVLGRQEPDGSLAGLLNKRFECPVYFSQDLLKADEHPILDTPHRINAFSAAHALAETRPLINFCQGDYGTDSFLKKYAGQMALTAGFILALFFAVLFSIWADIGASKKRISNLDNASVSIFKTTFPGINKVVDPLLQMKVELKKAREKIGVTDNDSVSAASLDYRAIDILTQLSEKIPDTIDVETTRLVLNPGRLVISGNTDNFNNVDKIKGLLESSDRFKQVRISNAAADKNGKRVRFKFIIDL